MVPQTSARDAVNALLAGRAAPPVLPASEPGARSDSAVAVPAPVDDSAPPAVRAESAVIHFAVGRSARSNKITSQHDLTFTQLAELLHARPPHVGQLTLEQYLACKAGTKAQKDQAAADKDGPWLSLSHFSKLVRTAPNVTTTSGYVGDFDAGSLTADEISAPLGACSHILYTTHSHSPAAPKRRLIVPYARPVSPDEHARLFDYFAALYGDAIDRSTRDPCRLWYFPGCAADTAQYREFHVRAGDGLFDPDAVLSASDEALPEASTTFPAAFAGMSAAVNDVLSAGIGYARPTVELVRDMLRYISIEDAPGKRRAPWFEALAGVHDWSAGSDEGFQLVHDWSATQPGYVDEADVRKIWDSCRRSGYTIATVIKMAIDGGWTWPTAPEIAAPSAPVSLEALAQPFAKDDWAAAVRFFVARFVFVTDQRAYYDLLTGKLITPEALDEGFGWLLVNHSVSPRAALRRSERTRRADSMGYYPGEPGLCAVQVAGRPLVVLNTYQQYVAEPIPPTPDEDTLFATYRQHLFQGPDGQLAESYILGALAWLSRNPKARLPVMIGLTGQPGCGKSLLLESITGLVFGGGNVGPINQAELEKGFTGSVADKRIGYISELRQGSARDAERTYNLLKELITSPVLSVQRKNQNSYHQPNAVSLFFTSNYVHTAAFLQDGDRRLFVYETPAPCMDGLAWKRDFVDFLHSDRAAGVIAHWLAQWDISSFDPYSAPPMTAAKRAMIESSRPPLQAELLEMIAAAEPPLHRDVVMLEELQIALRGRNRRLDGVTLNQLATTLQGAPISARKLPKRHRLPNGHRRAIWVVKNADAWVTASTETILKHLDTGAPLELVQSPGQTAES